MEPIQPPYDKHDMIPWDSNETERLEPEDAEVVRMAYPLSNALNILTKICWSPKDKYILLARCFTIIRRRTNCQAPEAAIRRIIAYDVYTGYRIANGEKVRDDQIWKQEDLDILVEAYPKAMVNAYLNKIHFALGDKQFIIDKAEEDILEFEVAQGQYNNRQANLRAAQEERDNKSFYRDAYREAMDPDWHQGRDDDN